MRSQRFLARAQRTQLASRQLRRQRVGRQSRAAFTLLELMLVLAILVVLAGVVSFNIFGAQDDAYAKTTLSQLQSLKQGVAMYRVKANGEMPESLDSLVSGPSDPNKKAMFGSPVIPEVPQDAWGNDFVYTLNGNKFEIRSAGIDGQMNSDDDLVVEG